MIFEKPMKIFRSTLLINDRKGAVSAESWESEVQTVKKIALSFFT